MILLASAYSLVALTVAPNAGPTIILAPTECNCFIASRAPSGLDFEFAINRLKCDEEFIPSKCLFTSYSAFSNATLTDLPFEENEPVSGKIAPITKSFLIFSLYVDESGG